MADTKHEVNELLERLLYQHSDLVCADALQAVGIDPDILIDAACALLHNDETGKSLLPQLCEEGVATLLKLALVVGCEAGIRSCAGFVKPS